jgi:hypothetical protein
MALNYYSDHLTVSTGQILYNQDTLPATQGLLTYHQDTLPAQEEKLDYELGLFETPPVAPALFDYNCALYNRILYNGWVIYYEDYLPGLEIQCEVTNETTVSYQEDVEMDISVEALLDKGYPLILDIMDYLPEKFRSLNLV